MNIQLNLIDNNPYRDLKLDPIDQDAVKTMAASVKDLGFWGGIAVRKVGNRYQLAFGHHRIEALRKLKWTKADLNVVKYDDDQMVRAMATENLLQRGGDSGGNNDAVAAIIRRLGYVMASNDWKSGLQNFGDLKKLFPTQNAYNSAKGKFEANGTIGEGLIHAYAPALSRSAIENALAELRASNYLERINQAIAEQIAEDAEEAQRRADELKSKEAKRKAQEEADKKREQQEKQEAVAEATKREAHYDPLVSSILKNQSHTAAFRKVVTSDNGKKYIPLGDQTRLAVTILEDAKKEKKRVTEKYVADKCKALIAKAVAMVAKEKKRIAQENADYDATQSFKKLKSQVNAMKKTIDDLTHAVDTKGGRIAMPEEIPTFFNQEVKELTIMLNDLESEINIDNVISHQFGG